MKRLRAFKEKGVYDELQEGSTASPAERLAATTQASHTALRAQARPSVSGSTRSLSGAASRCGGEPRGTESGAGGEPRWRWSLTLAPLTAWSSRSSFPDCDAAAVLTLLRL